MDGNEGILGIGDAASGLVSMRFGGAFLLRSDMLALPPQKRALAMVVLCLEDSALYWFNTTAQDGGLAPTEGSGSWMSIHTVLGSKSWSFAAAGLADADGIKTSIATAITAQSYSGVALNGAAPGAPAYGAHSGFAAWPSVTASNTAGAFTTNPIVFTGTYRGVAVTRTAALTGTDGNETVVADGPMETVTSIAVGAQGDTDGTLTFGWRDIGPGSNSLGSLDRFVVVSHADAANADTANVHVGYGSGTTTYTETTDTIEMAKGEMLGAYPTRIFSDSTAPITIYKA